MSYLTPEEALKLTDEEAECMIASMRWRDGPIRCVRCDNDHLYRITTRRKFSCTKCARQFSVTSGTVFHQTKLTLQQCVAGLAFYRHEGDTASHAMLARAIGITPTAARILKTKLFEAFASNMQDRSILTVGYFQGFTRMTQVDGELFSIRPRDGALRKV